MIRVLSLLVLGLPLAGQASEDALRQAYEQGDAALAAGRYDEAEKAFEQLRKLSPGTAEVYAKLGLTYFQQRKYDKAVPVLRQGLKLKPSLPNADVLLAMSLSELGQYKEALPGLQRGFKSNDRELKRMSGLQLERAYTGLQEDDRAVEVALQLTRAYPDDPEVLYQAGRLFGNFAFLAMRRLTSVAPNSVWRHQAAGEVYESQGNVDLALIEYQQILKLDPRRPGIHYRLGRVLLGSTQPDAREKAAVEFEQELQINPGNANAAYELAEIHRKAGQLDKAGEWFGSAVKADPSFQEAQLGLGRTLLAMGRANDALAHLQKSIALDPDDEVAYFQLSRAYAALGNGAEQQKALADYQKLRTQKLQREQSKIGVDVPKEVTKQEIDP